MIFLSLDTSKLLSFRDLLMLNTQKKRIALTYTIFSLMFFLILSKAFYIQVLNNDKLIQYSKSQILRENEIYPNRGNIYDRNGFPLAINIPTYSIFTIPKNIKSFKIYKELSSIVPQLNYKKIVKEVKKRNRYTWISRKIKLNDMQVEKIKKLKGIYIEAVPKRIYPNGEILSQTLGFVGVDNSGLQGIEYYFDKKLKGKSKIIKYVKDAKGRAVKFVSNKSTHSGDDLSLTIDKDLQAFVEKTLKEGVLHFNAKGGGVGVMDSKTGEILAIANYPTYNPKKISHSNSSHRKLSFVSNPFEPGSIFKIITIASALENNIAKADTNYYCERGRFIVEGHMINEAELKKKYEWLSVSEILKYSSNIGTTKIAFDLTYPKFQETLEKFKIGKKTGIEIPGESRGIFTASKNVSPIRLSNLSFGQGVATTGIQMLAAYGAIANDGVYVRPTILRSDELKEKMSERIISEKTAKALQKMLIEAVEDGTGGEAKIAHFTIAGKTSTAQKPSKSGGYKGHIPGFIGFPVNVERKFVIYAYVDEPKGDIYYGNSVAGPIFKKIAQYILYKDKEYGKFAKSTSKDIKTGFDRVKVRNSSIRGIKKDIVPNFVGLDKKTVKKVLKKIGVKGMHRGIGIVTKQSIPKGAKLSNGMVIKLHYAPPKYE
jgi:cell division protein FtsI (penicillin-binding protein 3)